MTTEEVVRQYYHELSRNADWNSLFADDVVFTSFTSPERSIRGREAFLQATRRFYGSIGSMEVRELLAQGDRACALVRYDVRSPNGAATFQSDVAEFFTVRDDLIALFGICFDTAPYSR